MEKLFDMTIIQTSDIPMEDTWAGDILVSPTDGGEFKGEKLSGKVLPIGMGMTYSLIGQDNVDSQMMLLTDDGVHILMEMKAYLYLSEEIANRIEGGEEVDPSEYYFKGFVTFKAGGEKYKWLERKVCVCENRIIDWENVGSTVYMV